MKQRTQECTRIAGVWSTVNRLLLLLLLLLRDHPVFSAFALLSPALSLVGPNVPSAWYC